MESQWMEGREMSLGEVELQCGKLRERLLRRRLLSHDQATEPQLWRRAVH
jgi:hypothetical protein